MAQKTFKEVFDGIKSNVTVSKKGKPVKSFSRSDFDRLAKAFVNEVGYTTEVVGTKDGEMVTKEVNPVEKFRGMLKVILQDFGVDKQEAQKIMDSYEIRNVDGLYELTSELVYQYINAGKKFDFMPKKDFVGSMSLKDVAAAEGLFTDIRTKEKISIKKEAHKLLEKKSKCPKWLKSKKNKKK
jgi:hypothetical protein